MKDMQVDDFELGTVKPIRACGTRRISHKLAAMRVAFDKYGLFISHIKEMPQDKSYASSARAKMIGYLRSWNRTAMIVKLGFYIDMLELISKLSLALQSDEIDPVRAIKAMGKISEKLSDMKEKDVNDYLSIRSLKRRISDIEGEVTYQGFKVRNLEGEIDIINNNRERLYQRLEDAIDIRLEIGTKSLMGDLATVLNTQGWKKTKSDGKKDLEFADDIIADLHFKFRTPLVNAGCTESESELINEWQHLIEYTADYLTPSSVSYLKTWRRIFNSDRAQTDFKNILILIELCFVIPVSNAKIERAFSRMKRLISKKRGSLSSDRLNNLMRIF